VPEGGAADAATPRRRWLRWVAASLVVLLLVGSAAAYRFDLGTRWLGLGRPSPVTQPAQVLPPAGLALPAARRAPAVADPAVAGLADPAAVRRAVDRLLRSKKLGRHTVAEVAELSTGKVVYRRGTDPVTPASTMKLLTTTAALQALGPEHRFTTSVVATPQSRRVVLVGGGDPLLARTPSSTGYPVRADLDTLARATAESLRASGRSRVRLGYDAGLFADPAVNPRWEPSYVTDDVVSPVSALWVDEGRERAGFSDRSPVPARTAAAAFAQALRRHGVTVVGRPRPAVAPGKEAGGQPIASVRSAPLAEVVQHVLEVSDNEGAEVLARHVAVARGLVASPTGASRAVRAALREVGVSTTGDRVYDGSGLSRDDRLSVGTLMAVLRAASATGNPRLRPVVTDLPVAGFTGSLASRFRTGDPAGRGAVRAKTGTLTGVHGLAGTATTRDGAVLGFVAIADRVKPVNTDAARARIDEVAAALAGCACAATP
jgi:serine-type D-Ala-D-Ala carboxypeptidase/endopeptidase (penicillin-binding protein 4)